jgi:hypothetical protein
MKFKRNQVEEAISRTTYPEDRSLGVDLRTKLKRLLDTDRALGRNARFSAQTRLVAGSRYGTLRTRLSRYT